MKTAHSTIELLQAMIEKGNPNSVTDAGVGILCVKAAVHGAYLNVMVNSKDLLDKKLSDEIMIEAKDIFYKNSKIADKLLLKVEQSIS